MAEKPMVSLFTDASLDGQSDLAAWAAWWKFAGLAGQAAGVFKIGMLSSGHAELGALANGLYCLFDRVALPPGTLILAQTDSTEIIHIMTSFKPMDAVKTKARSMINDMQRQAGVTVRLRHVHGHKGNSTPRHAVNTWCDREARKLMRAERDVRAQLNKGNC